LFFSSTELEIVIVLALAFGFFNGLRDSSSIVATMISSRTFHPGVALGMTAVAEFAGPFLFGTGVAKTIGQDIVQSNVLTLHVLMACLLGALIWSLITAFFGLPSSSSHALAGGMVGSVVMAASWNAVKLGGLYKILIALFALPLVGFIVGFLTLRLIYFLARSASPNINVFFKRSQVMTGLVLALSHGTNDAQKTMGIIVLSLLISGQLSEFAVPSWVIVASAATMAVGTLFGGWRLIRTLGGKFYKIRPVHSFAAQLTSASVVLAASLTGLPASTTQVVSSAIIGVGSSERLGKVRWSVADDIVTTWIVTIPASALLSGCIYWLVLNFT
jgi:PiT family inorganic phosphate transporter